MDKGLRQLRHVLKLALESKYEGERRKATHLLLHRMQQEGISLHELDPTFPPSSTPDDLIKKANLSLSFKIRFGSREERLLYQTLLAHVGCTEIRPGDDNVVEFQLTEDVKARVDGWFSSSKMSHSLQDRLATAQKQAMKEYKERREFLFMLAVEEEAQALAAGQTSVS